VSGEAAAIPAPQPLNLPILYIGVVALLIAGLQPVVLGGLAEAGRLSASGIGLAATAELLALGLACGVAAAVLKPTGLRAKLALACVGHALCNLASLWVADGALIGLRGVTGLFAGVMLWSTIGMIARSARPERQGDLRDGADLGAAAARGPAAAHGDGVVGRRWRPRGAGGDLADRGRRGPRCAT
jgi:hypothetical protein